MSAAAMTVRGGLSPGILDKVLNYIRARLMRRIDVEELAGVACLSAYHFAREFARSVGISPSRYVMRCRLERAAQLLTGSDWALSRIALELGFCDQSHFTRMFTQQTGETPHAYRQRRA